MKIFYLDADPNVAAQYLIDDHINKMIVESAQMLANCFPDSMLVSAPKTQKGNVRKHSYYNHPCSKWVRSSVHAARWLCNHAAAMDWERHYRFNSERHFSIDFIYWAAENLCAVMGDDDHPMPAPAEAFKDYPLCHVSGNSVQSYRNFYMLAKRFDKSGKPMDIWTRRGRPAWWDEQYIYQWTTNLAGI
jgi:hypothetical protein